MSSEKERKFIKNMTKEILSKKIAGGADITDMIKYINDEYKNGSLYKKADKETVANVVLKLLNAYFTIHIRQNVMSVKETLLTKELENMTEITKEEIEDNIPEELPDELKKEIKDIFNNKKTSFEETIKKIKSGKNENEIKIQIRAGRLEGIEYFSNFLNILSDTYPDTKIFKFLKHVFDNSKKPEKKELENIERITDIKYLDKIRKALDILKIKHFYTSKEDIEKELEKIKNDEKKKAQIIIGID